VGEDSNKPGEDSNKVPEDSNKRAEDSDKGLEDSNKPAEDSNSGEGDSNQCACTAAEKRCSVTADGDKKRKRAGWLRILSERGTPCLTGMAFRTEVAGNSGYDC
jgi:hypothetical protein